MNLEDFLEYDNNGKIYDDSNSDFIYQLKQLEPDKIVKYNNEHLDYIAYKEYKDESFWWILGIYNDILSPLEIDIDLIKIPDKQQVLSILTENFNDTNT